MVAFLSASEASFYTCAHPFTVHFKMLIHNGSIFYSNSDPPPEIASEMERVHHERDETASEVRCNDKDPTRQVLFKPFLRL